MVADQGQADQVEVVPCMAVDQQEEICKEKAGVVDQGQVVGPS